ncbi:monovalent cation/H+ antiporter subunit D [Roseococcus sp. YIM B11640]|uniref:monovalent cation/H+ antiporter subunit D n=1 Tax=Roseococcus sp. YIM B11640 TaxID=3133973 RepID=UPI003C7DB2CD
MSGLANHLAVLPIAIPLIAGALMIPPDEQRRSYRATLGIISILLTIAVAIALLRAADTSSTAVSVYRLGSWPAVLGIVLVADRLSAMLVLLSSILALAALVFSLSRWHKMGAHFHALLQFQLMGLNGAFLTGDLFNLFVFFEVMLAASYGLALHGTGVARVKAGLHYIAINLAASLLFLIGVSMIYGVTGTLNMADLAAKIPAVPADSRILLELGGAILGIVFLVKAGMWPLGFWLAPTYAAASPPAAAIFSMMSKVGVYAILRVSLLFFGAESGSEGFGGTWLVVGGLMTIAFGAVSVLATQDLPRLAGASVLVSSGTLLATVGSQQIAVTGGALYYLATSALAIGAFFLLIELLERGRELGADVLAVTMEAFGDGEEEEAEESEEVGVAIPATMAILGASFLCCALLLAGLPPLSGFIAKFAILTAVLNPGGMGSGTPVPVTAWLLLAALVLSGLAVILAMLRAGIRHIWAASDRKPPRVRVIEMAPILMLLLLCIGMTVEAGPVMRYMQATAASLHDTGPYVHSVLSEAGRARP